MHKIMGIVFVLVGVGGVLFAQQARMPTDSSGQDAWLAEVRALRAEISQIAVASIRTQLLVARLQLQEQRVLAAFRQLIDAQAEIASVQLMITGERERVRQLEDAASRVTGNGRQAVQRAILDAEALIDQQHQQEIRFKARETELQKAVADAQSRWMDFNDRLDAMERSLPVSADPNAFVAR